MNRVLVPHGRRTSYKPLHRELFWEKEEQNLYMYNKDHWVLIAGKNKQGLVEAGTNIEIVFSPEDTEKRIPIVRLKDDIDIDTMELGKFSSVLRWKGMVKLGEVTKTSFFPLIKYQPEKREMLGGKFIVKMWRDSDLGYSVYQATISSFATGSIFGSDDQSVKFTLTQTIAPSIGCWVGFRTFNDLREVEGNSIYLPPDKIEVWFNGWDSREDKNIPDNFGNDFTYSKVIARN